MRHCLAGLALLLLATNARAQAPEVTVRLYWLQAPAEVRLVPRRNEARIRLCPTCKEKPLAEPLRVRAAGERLQFEPLLSPAHSVEVSGTYAVEVPGQPTLSLDRPLLLRARGGRLLLTVSLPLEEYVAAVLAGESSNFTSEESLKAMAVAVRTYAAHFRGRHQAEGFDFCDTTHCQDFRLTAATARLRAAAEATEGELLWYEGEPAATYYHRHCGGTTEAAAQAWQGQRLPYLPQQADSFCLARNRGEWHSEITRDELRRALLAARLNPPRTLDSLAVLARTPSGRVARLRVGGANGITLSAAAFRRAVGQALGWDRIRSDLYSVRSTGDRFRFDGYGSGHGVGLCQVGAAQMGDEGKNYRQILEFYYPGTVLGLTAQGLAWQARAGERVELLTTRPRDDQWLLPLAERLLKEAEERSGWDSPFRPQLRVYPTVAAFRNATGQPGWVAASTRGRVIRLQPPQVLRAAGTLEATLRHEFLHELLESRAPAAAGAHAALPLWFREGLVLYLSATRPAGLGRRRRGNFPTLDALEKALRQPHSPAELRQAYAAAQARVEDLVAKHGREKVLSWVEQGLPPQR